MAELFGRRVAKLLPPPGVQRMFVLISFVSSIGMGLYVSGSAVYFVASVGLTAPQFGVGLAAAGAAGLLVGMPIGHFADRVGTRAVTIVLTAMQAVLLGVATMVSSFWMFLCTVVLLGAAQTGATISRNAMVSAVVQGPERVRLSAYSRSALNAGFSIGVLGTGIAIGLDNKAAYLALIWATAVIALVTCLMHLRLPVTRTAGRSSGKTSGTAALRDLPYMLVAQVTGLTRLGDTILTVGLPLWVITHTSAPRQLAAWLIGINTCIIVLFQVQASRAADTVDGAARVQGKAYLALILTCAVVGISAGLPAWPAALVLIVVTVLLTTGEMWGEAARWALRYELAPANAQGQYGGAFALGTAVPSVLGPILVTTLTDKYGLTGWLAIGGIFVLGIAASRPAIAWAQRTRPLASI